MLIKNFKGIELNVHKDNYAKAEKQKNIFVIVLD